MTFLIFGVRVRVSFLLAMGLCAAVLLPGRLIPLLAVVIALHEAGHFTYVFACKMRIKCIDFSLFGVRVTLSEGRLREGQELLLNLSGPAVNLLSGGLLLLWGDSMQAKRAAAVHLAVAAATLFPLGNSDGAAIAANLLGRCRRLSVPARIWLRRGLAVLYFAGIMAAGGAFG